ncbi:hypothetical protein GCM10009596_09870 [Arthrobacter rhombi]
MPKSDTVEATQNLTKGALRRNLPAARVAPMGSSVLEPPASQFLWAARSHRSYPAETPACPVPPRDPAQECGTTTARPAIFPSTSAW